jgi:hypothetical protein
MISLQTRVEATREQHYDGTQLAPHWILRHFDLRGDALVAFRGGADVSLEHMVDLEDVRAAAPIYSPLMLHFLGEWFIDSLDQGILLQHLFVDEIYQILLERGCRPMRRRGNDIYYQERKLSVSIATRSPVSVLMHTALNIRTEGTPVPTSGLAELGVDPIELATEALARFQRHSEIWRAARVKVLPR